jgi:hypothetical protein
MLNKIEWRNEKKFVMNFDHSTEFTILTHPLMFREIYAERKINNIYFDTSNFEKYFASINGLNERDKIRFRWYGDTYENINEANLEYKIKKGELGCKKQYRLNSVPHLKLDDIERHVEQFLNCELPGTVHTDMKLLQPSLMNSYQRKYYLSICDQFRITLDFNIRSIPLRFVNNFPFENIFEQDVSVLEIKYGDVQKTDSRIAINSLPYNQSRNSKYVNGLGDLYL